VRVRSSIWFLMRLRMVGMRLRRTQPPLDP
jgi:hypothetical protein